MVCEIFRERDAADKAQLLRISWTHVLVLAEIRNLRRSRACAGALSSRVRRRWCRRAALQTVPDVGYLRPAIRHCHVVQGALLCSNAAEHWI